MDPWLIIGGYASRGGVGRAERGDPTGVLTDYPDSTWNDSTFNPVRRALVTLYYQGELPAGCGR